MAKPLTLELTDEEAAEIEATFQVCTDELRRLSEQRAQDDVEIARLRAETEAIAADSRAITARTRTITDETRAIAAESRAIGEESRAIGEQMKALRQETLAAIASLGAA